MEQASTDKVLTDTGQEIEIGISDEEREKRRKILDKKGGKELEKNWQAQDKAEIELKEQALAPPVITEPRCQVCNSEYRAYIERCLVKGIADQRIADSVPGDAQGIKPSRKSIKNHLKEHMRIDHAVIREELEEEAKFLKQNIETGVKGALTAKGMLNVIARKGYEDFLAGITTAEVKDIIQLQKVLIEMDASNAQVKNEETEAMFRLFMRAIQNVCSQDVQTEIGNEVRRLRQLDDFDSPVELEMADAEISEIPTPE